MKARVRIHMCECVCGDSLQYAETVEGDVNVFGPHQLQSHSCSHAHSLNSHVRVSIRFVFVMDRESVARSTRRSIPFTHKHTSIYLQTLFHSSIHFVSFYFIYRNCRNSTANYSISTNTFFFSISFSFVVPMNFRQNSLVCVFRSSKD